MPEARASLAACVLLVAAYVPFLGGGLLTDDFVHLARLERAVPLRRLLTTPDSFGFYRPLTQASIAADAALHGHNATAYRVTNLVLHAGVLASAFAVARLLTQSATIAALATLAFALAPKAPPIAVLWISARGELLMSLFAFASVASWIQWTRGRSSLWLAAALTAYPLAVLSKESAVLLPALLLLTPGSSRPLRARLPAVAVFVAAGAALLWWRTQTGAMTPFSASSQYNLAVPPARLLRNAENYAGRLLPSPLALLAIVGVPAWLASRRSALTAPAGAAAARLLLFGGAWTMVFLAPALPITARNELYLYLPAFGVCLAAAVLVGRAMAGAGGRRVVIAALACYAVGLGAYQAIRSLELHRDLVFAARLTDALASREDLRSVAYDLVALTPTDAATRQYLQDSVSGYLPFVLRHAFERQPAARRGGPAVQLRCTYDGERVTLR